MRKKEKKNKKWKKVFCSLANMQIFHHCSILFCFYSPILPHLVWIHIFVIFYFVSVQLKLHFSSLSFLEVTIQTKYLTKNTKDLIKQNLCTLKFVKSQFLKVRSHGAVGRPRPCTLWVIFPSFTDKKKKPFAILLLYFFKTKYILTQFFALVFHIRSVQVTI